MSNAKKKNRALPMMIGIVAASVIIWLLTHCPSCH